MGQIKGKCVLGGVLCGGIEMEKDGREYRDTFGSLRKGDCQYFNVWMFEFLRD